MTVKCGDVRGHDDDSLVRVAEHKRAYLERVDPPHAKAFDPDGRGALDALDLGQVFHLVVADPAGAVAREVEVREADDVGAGAVDRGRGQESPDKRAGER